jgi:hypothetical protein
MFFATDITHLRFTGSQALLEAEQRQTPDRAAIDKTPA